jgi:hypothetical protein
MRRLVVAAAAVLVAAATLPANPAGGLVRPADVTTTVDFEAYPTGTQITNQYTGITFERCQVASPTAPPLTVSSRRT